MSFSRQEVDALARLARLALTDDERTLITRQLAEIVDYARQVADVDTSAAGSAPATIPAAPLRVDAVQPSLDRLDVTGAAPDADATAGLIKVPRVLG